jgi:hypothetical protein
MPANESALSSWLNRRQRWQDDGALLQSLNQDVIQPPSQA